MRGFRTVLTLTLAALALAGSIQAQTARITVKADQPGVTVSPTLYGIFFEEINRAGDGGIYGEMIENRSFEDNRYSAFSAGRRPGRSDIREGEVYTWTLRGAGRMALDTSRPLNLNNPTALRLQCRGEAAVVNAGFRGVGLNVAGGATYLLALHARSVRGIRPLTARLEGKDGKVLAEAEVGGIGPQWKKYELALKAQGGDTAGRLVLSTTGRGVIFLDMVSLFPKDTWKERPNGLRKDLMQMLVDMKPGFVRFPGGCFVEGDELKTATRWKKTIGPIEERPGHWNLWGYLSTDGLGFHEYLLMSEDLGAEPLFVINCGMAHKDSVPLDKMGEMVQDALDAIEYCNGPAESKWGKARAAAGHPAPFNLKYIEIGNENGGPLYTERYPLFVKAIREKYPQMHIISNGWRGNESLVSEFIDEHYYNTPEFFMQNAGKYDKYPRPLPKIYVGEYAVTRGAGQGNLAAALGEAAFMTGLERNSDVVVLGSYAPLFVNNDWRQWNPDAIVYDQARVFGTPSYHVQALFANHRADVVLPVEISAPEVKIVKSHPGRFGVGTWNTQAEFKDIVVTGADGQVLFKSNFDEKYKIPEGRAVTGKWSVADGALRQTGKDQPARILFGDPAWADYTIELKARKVSGAEGFLISFGVQNANDKNWWNLGGWGNKRHGIEAGGIGDEKAGTIQTGKWYEIKIETRGEGIKCWLDGKLVHDASRGAVKSLYAVAGLKPETKEVILKVVNASGEAQPTAIEFTGAGKLEPQGRAIVMAGTSWDDENSFETPKKIAPRETKLRGVTDKFNYTFLGNSVTVLRLKQGE